MRDWESENLTPLGRLTILKTLLLANLKPQFCLACYSLWFTAERLILCILLICI